MPYADARPTCVSIDSIKPGDRVRKDMGDIKTLAESMSKHGLLHPVVVTRDYTLVAGARRIEAAKLLGLAEVPVTVVDVDDLLSAERDENEERKDFTPTEAVAIGRLIEERHRELIAAQRPAQLARASRLGVAARTGTTTLKEDGGQSLAVGSAHGAAARAVGMSEGTYHRAKVVAAAAEANPERFGDLPSRMDETGNVAGAVREMVRRGGPTNQRKAKATSRSAIHARQHYPKPNQEMQRAVTALEGICLGLQSIDVKQLDADKVEDWSLALANAASFLRRLSKGMTNASHAA